MECNFVMLTLRCVTKSSKSCNSMRAGVQAVMTESPTRSMACPQFSVQHDSTTRQEKMVGKGQEKAVRNHCDAYSTGTTPYSCKEKILTPEVSIAVHWSMGDLKVWPHYCRKDVQMIWYVLK